MPSRYASRFDLVPALEFLRLPPHRSQ
jgi:hypothetical protein